MKRKILIYRWGSLSESSFIRALEENGDDCVEFSMKLTDYHADAAFSERFLQKLHREKPDAVFSFDYFPLLSMLCEINGVPCLSWVYDCPQYTLLSETVKNTVNHIFCFDAVYAERLHSYGARHVYHLPLSADVEGFRRTLRAEEPGGEGAGHDGMVSFVGSLYNEEKNRLRHVELSDYTRGYVEGLICSQLKIYGYNLLGDAMKDSAAEEIVEKCGLSLSDSYIQIPVQLAVDAVGMEVSAREREMAIDLLSEHFPVTLYTASSLPAAWKKKRLLTWGGYADYQKEMPFIFHNSRINLNITSRTIESGIPQRVLDILACGGFCMTNFQPEIAEFFTDGEELAMYSGMGELLEKTAYYLEHEEESVRIAALGYERVKEKFALKNQVEKMKTAVGL